MKKRAVIELQFNWIFVLIAGAIIFVFFISIVNKQREFSELKTSGTIITNLESILTGAQISTNTVNIVDMPKIDVGFECDRYFIGPVPKQTKGNVIFSPNLLKGKEIITWALDWNMPYRVTNFLYITDPELRYVIVYDDDTETIARKIDKELPKEMNKELIDKLENLKNKNNYKVKFIFLTDASDNDLNDIQSELKMPDEDLTAIELDIGDSGIIPNTGTIDFIQKNGTLWGREKIAYLKKESLFGAIFAADSEMYNCVMRKAFKKLNLVSKIYLNRSSTLADYYGIDNIGCASVHSYAVIELKKMRDASEEELNDFPIGGLGRMDAMMDYSNNIKNENQRAQLFSCALIY